MKNIQKLLVCLCPLLLAGCQGNHTTPDAYGNFEATEIMVPAQTQGILVSLDLEEGQVKEAGQVVGLVDTLALHLKKQQLNSQITAVLTRMKNVEAEAKVLEKQLSNLETDRLRLQGLLDDGAVPRKQLEDLEGNMEVLELRIDAVRSQTSNILAEKKVLDSQVEQVEDQVRRSIITCPASGTILEKYAEKNEMVAPGRSLFKLADLETMYLMAFVSATQLDDLKTGQEVEVRFDSDEKTNHTLPGVLTWISPQAEFTPKIIQTKEERVTLVYGVKVAVKNDGRIKVGMPGELVF